MPNKQHRKVGYVRPGPHPVNAERRAAREQGLSGRQKVKARKAARRAAQRAAGLANVLAVKQTMDVFVDPRAKLIEPGDVRLARRPPSPRPGPGAPADVRVQS